MIHFPSWIKHLIQLNNSLLNQKVIFNFFLSEQELPDDYMLLLPEFESHAVDVSLESVRDFEVFWVLFAWFCCGVSDGERAW